MTEEQNVQSSTLPKWLMLGQSKMMWMAVLTVVLGVLVGGASVHARTQSNLVAGAVPADVMQVQNPGRVGQQGAVEVVEFFWYGCGHCASFHPKFDAWQRRQPKTVRVQLMPAAWNGRMVIHQRLFYTLMRLGRLDLHGQIFADVAESEDGLTSSQSVLNWVRAQGMNEENWVRVFNSQDVSDDVRAAQMHFERFELSGVPAVVVDGTHQIIQTDRMIQTLDAWVKQRLKQAH